MSAWQLLIAVTFWIVRLQVSCSSAAIPLALRGHDWLDSAKGNIRFGTWYMNDWSISVTGQTIKDWAVVDSSRFDKEGIIAFRSLDTFNATRAARTMTLYSYLCLKFISLYQDGRAFKYYQLHRHEILADNERVYVHTFDNLTSVDEICKLSHDVWTAWEEEFRVLIMDNDHGTCSDIVARCPDHFIGRRNYTYISHDGSRSTERSLEVCSSKTGVTLEEASMENPHFFSAGGILHCLHTVDVYWNRLGTISYTMVYNMDASVDRNTTHRFACIASTTTGENFEATVVPGGCMALQMPYINSYVHDMAGRLADKLETYSYAPCDEDMADQSDYSLGFKIAASICCVLPFLLLLRCLVSKYNHPHDKGRTTSKARTGNGTRGVTFGKTNSTMPPNFQNKHGREYLLPKPEKAGTSTKPHYVKDAGTVASKKTQSTIPRNSKYTGDFLYVKPDKKGTKTYYDQGTGTVAYGKDNRAITPISIQTRKFVYVKPGDIEEPQLYENSSDFVPPLTKTNQ